MQVTDIEISQCSYCTKTARHYANVRVTLQGRIVSLLCKLDLPPDENAWSRDVAFISEAARQLRRMPEFRSGRETLSFARDISNLPDPLLV